MESQTLAAVLGANCKHIRTDAGITQDELARHARQFGLRWTASKVRDFEVGRTAPTFATVLAVSAALDSATAPLGRTSDQVFATKAEPRVRLADLVRSEGFVTITDEFDPSGERLADYCTGQTWELLGSDMGRTATPEKLHKLLRTKAVVGGTPVDWMRTVDLENMRRASGLTEYRLAQRLGISRDRLAAMSFRLWHKTFSAERDRLAGPDANKQKRGQITRKLRADLEKAIGDGHD